MFALTVILLFHVSRVDGSAAFRFSGHFFTRLLVKTLAGDQTISQYLNSVVLLRDQVQEKRNEIRIIKCYTV